MKNKLLKIIWISLGSFSAIVLVLFSIYVILYYPRKAEPFEVTVANPLKKVLIATQGSDFKDAFTKTLCDSLEKSSVYIKGIDVGQLDEINEKDYNKILIINSFIINLNRSVDRFITKAENPENILAFVTSGGADWRPQPQFRVDAVTSASKEAYLDNLVKLIIDWIAKEDSNKWRPDEVLALIYFSQVDVKNACNTIEMEQGKYKALYPNLSGIINRTGYQYLRLKNVPSALEIFMLNIKLFPDLWNVYDSYGDALLASGDQKSAIKYFQQALNLNPDSKSSKNKLEKLKP